MMFIVNVLRLDYNTRKSMEQSGHSNLIFFITKLKTIFEIDICNNS